MEGGESEEERQIVRNGGEWLQFATYPQSPDSHGLLLRLNGPVPGILQPTGPGRLWII